MPSPSPESFYDELAELYDLIFEDWETSMERQGSAIATLLERYLTLAPSETRVLDVAAGIGTQSIPLARRGYRVSSRDLSAASIRRLQREVEARGLSVDSATADMRTVGKSCQGDFHAVLAFDNAVPHLLSDEDLRIAFRSFYQLLRPGGVCLLSVRDYEQVARGKDSVHPYGIRWRDGVRYVPLQVWHWVSPTHYDLAFYWIAEKEPLAELHRSTARYYAVSTGRLLELLAESGFTEGERLDGTLYQPVLVARRPRES